MFRREFLKGSLLVSLFPAAVVDKKADELKFVDKLGIARLKEGEAGFVDFHRCVFLCSEKPLKGEYWFFTDAPRDERASVSADNDEDGCRRVMIFRRGEFYFLQKEELPKLAPWLFDGFGTPDPEDDKFNHLAWRESDYEGFKVVYCASLLGRKAMPLDTVVNIDGKEFWKIPVEQDKNHPKVVVARHTYNKGQADRFLNDPRTKSLPREQVTEIHERILRTGRAGHLRIEFGGLWNDVS